MTTSPCLQNNDVSVARKPKNLAEKAVLVGNKVEAKDNILVRIKIAAKKVERLEAAEAARENLDAEGFRYESSVSNCAMESSDIL